MSLYYDAATVLSSASHSQGSLRSRIYDGNITIKSSPQLVYGLVTECAKWDIILSEVIDNARMMSQEPKLTPLLAILLVHDLLLSKRGIACPQNHPLRLAIERHKVRLAAELTKARVRRKCETLEALRLHIVATKSDATESGARLRWVRINNLKIDPDEDARTMFSTFKECHVLEELCTSPQVTKAYILDINIPYLLATNASTREILNSSAYQQGKVILQDKASCFPAHLALNSKPDVCESSKRTGDGDILDACAAPGNKTSHVASILANKPCIITGKETGKRVVFACERDAKRSKTLRDMLDRAGALNRVVIIGKQDFLALDPQDPMFRNVTHLLLDPSCSGSGIVNREDVPTLLLPKDPRKRETHGPEHHRIENGIKKRRRDNPRRRSSMDGPPITSSSSPPIDADRLRKLSNLQTRIIEHAFTFPNARLVTYSTCSIHVTENEAVALRALKSAVARRLSWRLLRRDEQPDGLRIWPHRGNDLDGEPNQGVIEEGWNVMTAQERESFKEACIRCQPGGADGTMGFFVVGFVRDRWLEEKLDIEPSESDGGEWDEGDEWQGFSADEGG